MKGFATARAVTSAVAEILRPSSRMLPAVAATKFKLKDKDGVDWDPDLAPYMLEPLNLLGSRRYTGIVFVGPARSSKSMALLYGGVNFIANCAPGDTQIVQMSKDAANEFSSLEFDPVSRQSPGLRDRLAKRNNNIFSKRFVNGMSLRFSWPSVTQLSSKTLRYIFITDYERPENRDNVDGEGSLWDLAAKRIATYLSRGKVVAESSPGEDWVDASWAPEHPHQAPPCLGILSIYNLGTMARFYWACADCGHRIQCKPGAEMFDLPQFRDLVEEIREASANSAPTAAQSRVAKAATEGDEPISAGIAQLAERYASIKCPACGFVHTPKHKRQLNLSGVWLHTGEEFDAKGNITGERIDTSIASFWLGGAGAAFQPWKDILSKYFQAVQTWMRTQDESKLRTITNTDLAAPYMPRAAAMRRKAEDLIRRSKFETCPKGYVPKGVELLIGTFDVQSSPGRFVISIIGYGKHGETWLVDRYVLTHSTTRMEGGRPDYLNPATYDEDWVQLGNELLEKEYPIEEAPDVTMKVYFSVGDSGGAAGVTQRAYDFYRHLVARNRSHLMRLYKGANSIDAPRVKETEGQTTEDELMGLPVVPLVMVNTTTLKDAVFSELNRNTPGPGYMHLPYWLEPAVFGELVAETRGLQGWKKKPGQKNEQGDLHVMARVAYILIGGEAIDWENPPVWARRPTKVKDAPDTMVAAAKSIYAELGMRRNGNR